MLNEGDALPSVEKTITQDAINRYADAAGDFNPIHINEKFAATTQFGGTIAHGMMVAATVSEMMSEAFSRDWARTGKLRLRFRAPVRPGDVITVFGHVKRVDEEDGRRDILCSVGVKKGGGESAIAGDASVTESALGM